MVGKSRYGSAAGNGSKLFYDRNQRIIEDPPVEVSLADLFLYNEIAKLARYLLIYFHMVSAFFLCML